MRLVFVLLLIGSFGPWFATASYGQAKTDEQLGYMYYNNREWEKAVSIFEDLFAKSPNQVYYFYLVNSYIELKDYDAASRIIRKSSKLFPSDPRYDVDVNYLQILQGQSEKGHKGYERLLKDLKADKNAVFALANAFNNRRETEYALKTYQRGRELLKDPTAFAFEMAYMNESLGNEEVMIDEYMNLLSASPEQKGMVFNRLQAWLSDDPEGAKNEAYRQILLRKVQEHPDEALFNELLLWHSIQQKDFDLALLQAKALDKRYGENGQRVLDLARLCASNQDFATAQNAYEYLIKKNTSGDITQQSRLELLNTRYERYRGSFPHDLKQATLLCADYQKMINEFGKTSFTLPLILNLSDLLTFELHREQEAIDVLNQTLEVPNLPATDQASCKLRLADIYLYTGDPWEATLLYSQIEKAFKNEPVGHEAKFRNARLYFYIGEFDWARAQLDILKAATSKLISNDALDLSLLISNNIEEDSNLVPLSMFAQADLLFFRGMPAQALAKLDSAELMFPHHSIVDDICYERARIFTSQGEFDQAASQYSRIDKEFADDILADDALYHLGRLYQESLNQPAKAMECYKELLSKYPGSLFVVDARKRYRELRKDPVN